MGQGRSSKVETAFPEVIRRQSNGKRNETGRSPETVDDVDRKKLPIKRKVSQIRLKVHVKRNGVMKASPKTNETELILSASREAGSGHIIVNPKRTSPPAGKEKKGDN